MLSIKSFFSKFQGLSKRSKLLIIAFVLTLIAIPVILYAKRPTPSQQAAAQINTIVASLSKKVDLPSGTPSVYTVSDATKLKGEAFFAKAKNGDKVLVYVNAKKAFLYRPTEDKLIEVAYYNSPAPTEAVAGASTSVTPTPTPTLEPTATPFVLPMDTTTPTTDPNSSPTP